MVGESQLGNFHKSSAEGTERRRDERQTKAERSEAEERKQNPTDVHPNRPPNRFKSTHPSGPISCCSRRSPRVTARF